MEDVGNSLETHGFKNIVYIGDSGGNQRGMAAVAERLSAAWTTAGKSGIASLSRYVDVNFV